MNGMRLIFRRWGCPPEELDMHEAGKQNGDSLDDAARGSMHEAVKQTGNNEKQNKYFNHCFLFLIRRVVSPCTKS